MTIPRAALAGVFAIGVLVVVVLLRPSPQVTAGGDGCEIRLERIVDLKSDSVGWGPTVLIGDAIFHGQFDEVWNSGKPVQPDPYLDGYDWAKDLKKGR